MTILISTLFPSLVLISHIMFLSGTRLGFPPTFQSINTLMKWTGGMSKFGEILPTIRSPLPLHVLQANISLGEDCLIAIKHCGAPGRSLDQRNIILRGTTFIHTILICIRDTGYRSVADGQDEDTVPRCPAFQLIGQKYGPFHLASYFSNAESADI